ncbi:MAG: hypothetical protein NTY68_03035 [Candidatus Micrarchaeota archaeon]|nr:hypothetical protein [Candidatus Micrarchaeota archaeon]
MFIFQSSEVEKKPINYLSKSLKPETILGMKSKNLPPLTKETVEKAKPDIIAAYIYVKYHEMGGDYGQIAHLQASIPEEKIRDINAKYDEYSKKDSAKFVGNIQKQDLGINDLPMSSSNPEYDHLNRIAKIAEEMRRDEEELKSRPFSETVPKPKAPVASAREVQNAGVERPAKPVAKVALAKSLPLPAVAKPAASTMEAKAEKAAELKREAVKVTKAKPISIKEAPVSSAEALSKLKPEAPLASAKKDAKEKLSALPTASAGEISGLGEPVAPKNRVALMEALLFVIKESRELNLPLNSEANNTPEKSVDLYMRQIVEHYKNQPRGGLKKARDFYDIYRRKMNYEGEENAEKLGEPVKHASADALTNTYMYLSDIDNPTRKIDLERVTPQKVNSLMKSAIAKLLKEGDRDEAERLYGKYKRLMSGEEIA